MSLCRLSKRESASEAWKQSVCWIVSQTQAVMKVVYGGTLKLSTDRNCH